MNLIETFDQLKYYSIENCKQFWYYVILLNPRDITPAGKIMLDNFELFNLDSDKDCHYFVPGFINSGKGLVSIISTFLQGRYNLVTIPEFGEVRFNSTFFVNFYKELEDRNNIGWRYSGECELLLFNLSMNNKVKLNDFVSYNLDDIVRNNRNVSEFIRLTINVGKDATDQTTAKLILDEKFYELIMPDSIELLGDLYEKGWNTLRQNGFKDNSYLFISYSSKDYRKVSKIRNSLCAENIPCWMAPFDIPPGFNYALIIEHAIKHSQKFVLMLSKSAVNSVWVGKELKRAISRFQLASPEKICIVWLNGKFELADTPFALPLEDIQISIDLASNPNNYYLLVSEEKLKEIKMAEKICKCQDEITNYLSPDKFVFNLRQIVSRARAIDAIKVQMSEPIIQLKDLCDKLNSEIKALEQLSDITHNNFVIHYTKAIELLCEIKKHIYK